LRYVLNKPIFETLTILPSPPGIRLKEVFLRSLQAEGIKCLFQKHVLNVAPTQYEFQIDIGRDTIEAKVNAKGIILATGRFLGRGLDANRDQVKETLFDLPVFQPVQRKDWHKDNFLEPSGHALNQSGIETDSMFLPLSANSQPAFKNLYAAGTILAHQGWMRMKCGSGLSIATAYGAVKSFLKTK
jgi:glycerol-3-phosphate dehydrogenase subunit B